jgi:alpha-aminoadipic semialdehyde synthase
MHRLGAWPSSTPHPDLPPPPSRALSALDAFAQLLQHALRYRPGERDMVILSHERASAS